jgi:uncharacterized linocin/CFP29 family protein
MDMLKRSLAPLPDAAWTILDETVVRVLKAHLSARTLVDFKGPLGWDYAAVNVGQLATTGQAANNVPWGVRGVLPLVETRVPFTLSRWDVDNAVRGSQTLDLKPAEDAARRIARFEETAAYLGFPEGQIQGLVKAASNKPVPLPKRPEDLPHVLSVAMHTLRDVSVVGPYALVLDRELYHMLLQTTSSGYPLLPVVREIVQGPIVPSAVVTGGLLLSTRGGDFELTVGGDFAIGYQDHDKQHVELFLTESFTFRVLEPAAAVALVSAG